MLMGRSVGRGQVNGTKQNTCVVTASATLDPNQLGQGGAKVLSMGGQCIHYNLTTDKEVLVSGGEGELLGHKRHVRGQGCCCRAGLSLVRSPALTEPVWCCVCGHVRQLPSITTCLECTLDGKQWFMDATSQAGGVCVDSGGAGQAGRQRERNRTRTGRPTNGTNRCHSGLETE